jgi:carbamoyltransferase
MPKTRCGGPLPTRTTDDLIHRQASAIVTSILGISAYYHDSAAALVCDGSIAAAAQEERFTRVKHDSSFPAQAVDYCLGEAGIDAGQIDFVAFYDKPVLKFDRLLETWLAYAPRGLASFMTALPPWLKTKLHLPAEIRKALRNRYQKKIVFTKHHESHAASAFFPSPFERAAILTIDGVGEWDTATIGIGEGNRIKLLKSLSFPHSLGLLYSAFTSFCGFRVNSGEYKLMGLAPYGEPQYKHVILDKLADLKEDGSLALDMSYFHYCEGLRMTNDKFAALFGGPARRPETVITEREMDLAASIQAVAEETVLRMARHARELTGCGNLCMAGGVALNCVANGKLLRSGVFKDLFVQPAAGDAGGALGAAMFVHHQLLDNPRQPASGDCMRGSLLGPAFAKDRVRADLDGLGAVYEHVPDERELLRRVAADVAAGKVVGWFQGRMEFGPRALGSRSLLGDARNPEMQSRMNLRIKYRESFRPFAAAVLAEDVARYFEHEGESPYMLIVAGVRPEHHRSLDEGEQSAMIDPDLTRRVNVPRSSLPAITHVDMSARIQTVDEPRHGRFYRLLGEFKRQTGCGVMINTSFNIRGEPIVCAPNEAFQCFLATAMDTLVMEDFILRRDNQRQQISETARNRHIGRFQPD